MPKKKGKGGSPMTKAKVLFLCTSNSARSQMAEAFLRKHGGDEFEAYSAGLEPKPIHPFTVRVMEEAGVSLSGQYSKHLKEYMGKVHFGFLITVCNEAETNCPTAFPSISQRIHWSFEDPVSFVGSEDETLAKFRDVRDKIDQRIKAWLGEQKAA
jgi:arsenate reductase